MDKKENEVVYDTTCFGYRVNPDKTIDLVTIRLNSDTGDSEVLNERQKYTEEYRAAADINKMQANFYFKGKP